MKQGRSLDELIQLLHLRLQSLRWAFFIGFGGVPSRGSLGCGVVRKEQFAIDDGSRQIAGTCYSRHLDRVRPTFIVAPGIGGRHRRQFFSENFLFALASLGYHVIVPAGLALQSYLISRTHVEYIKSTARAVSALKFVDANHIALMGSGWGATNCLLSILDEDIRRIVRAVLLLAPVTDVRDHARFAFTGDFRSGGKRKRLVPAYIPRILFLYQAAEFFVGERHIDNFKAALRCFLMDRSQIAWERVRQLPIDQQQLVLDLYRGDNGHRLLKRVYAALPSTVMNFISPENLREDIDFPVFVIHSIRDRYVNYGQSTHLYDMLKSRKGVYLQLSNFLLSERVVSWRSNPAGWLSGLLRLSRILYKYLAVVHSAKCLPHNPMKRPLRVQL